MKLKKNYSFFIAILLVSFSFFKAQTASDFFISDGQGNQNPVIDCSYPFVNGSCINLTANYLQFKQTDNYAVSSINYTPYAVVNKTVITGNLDDSFSGIIGLPFNFCFYGQTYTQLVIGSNGMISFDIDQANQPNPANFSEALPNQNLPKEAIFGVFHDMFFSESNGSEINYKVIGTAPYRKFVVNFRNGRISGCDSEASSSQIVLSEGSNNIEIFVENKPLACDLASVKNAVIGINDATGDLGLAAAPERNTGNWSAQNEAWLFSPKADSLTPEIIWYDSNNNIIETNETNETNKDLKVCPTKNETYRVEIIYTNCNNEEIIYSDTINVNFAADYPLVKDYSKIFCNSTEQVYLKDYKSSIVTGDPSFFNFEFRDAVTNQILNENTPFTITSNRNIKVTVSNKKDANCKKVANLSFLSQNIYNDKPVICDFANDGVENNFLLSNLNSQLVRTNYQGTVSYFTSKNDAENNQNAITNSDITTSENQFYIRLVQGECVNVLGPIEVRFNSSPVVNVNNDSLNVTICDNNADGVENFNWGDYLKDKITVTAESEISIRVFKDYKDAFTASNQLTQIREGKYIVFARVQSASGCFSIADVNMNVTFNSIEAKDITKFICFDGNENKTIDLNSYKNEMLVNPSDVPVAFFGSVRDAQNNLPSREISSTQTVNIGDYDYISKNFYARFSNGDCYTIKRIRIVLVKLTVNNKEFKVCDIKNDGLERITLSRYTREINNQKGTRVAFYLSEPEANDGSTTGLRFLDLRSSSTVYARISLSDCFLVDRITFNLVPTPNIVTEIVREFPIYCDNLADGKENIDLTHLQPIINTNNELVEFSYFKSYNESNGTFADPYSDPLNAEVQDGEILYVKVKYKDSDCFSVAKVTVKLPVINDVINLNKDVVLKICNEDFSVSETFNLEDAVPQLFHQENNEISLDSLQITYYVNENSAKQGTSAGKISASYISSAANTYVYARFQSRYGCYSIAPINLLFVLPAKAINSEITICDNNLDGKYDVNLLAYKDSMVQNPSDDNIFKFYKVLPDNSRGEEITNPEHFIVDANTSKIWVYVENLTNCGSYAEINFKTGEVLTLGQKQFKIDNICDTNNDKKEILDLTGFESNFSSSYTYEYYGNQSDLWLGQNKIQNPTSYAYDGNSGNSTIYVKVSQEGFCPDFYTIDVVLKTTPMIEIPDYYYCKNDMVGIEIRPNFNGLNVVNYHWELADGTIKDGVDYLTNIKTLGTYTLTLTNSQGCTYTTTFKVLNEETPRIVSLTGKNDYYTIKAEGIPGKKIVYSKNSVAREAWQDSNVFYNLEAGDYTFYVKYADSDCYGDSIKGKIFNLKNAFSPNGDGINDYWELTGLDVFSNNSTLQIFDRYGNMVYKEVSNTEFRWDGKSNSRVLNSDTYWFVITAGDERIYKGWIYLKNKK